MKTLMAAAIVVALTSPVLAEMGNISGTESRGEPKNSSFRASGQPVSEKGAAGWAKIQKKRQRHNAETTGSGSAYTKSHQR